MELGFVWWYEVIVPGAWFISIDISYWCAPSLLYVPRDMLQSVLAFVEMVTILILDSRFILLTSLRYSNRSLFAELNLDMTAKVKFYWPISFNLFISNDDKSSLLFTTSVLAMLWVNLYYNGIWTMSRFFLLFLSLDFGFLANFNLR